MYQKENTQFFDMSVERDHELFSNSAIIKKSEKQFFLKIISLLLHFLFIGLNANLVNIVVLEDVGVNLLHLLEDCKLSTRSLRTTKDWLIFWSIMSKGEVGEEVISLGSVRRLYVMGALSLAM